MLFEACRALDFIHRVIRNRMSNVDVTRPKDIVCIIKVYEAVTADHVRVIFALRSLFTMFVLILS